jgi:hypothetical protein
MRSVLAPPLLMSILVKHRPLHQQQRRLVGVRHAHVCKEAKDLQEIKKAAT